MINVLYIFYLINLVCIDYFHIHTCLYFVLFERICSSFLTFFYNCFQYSDFIKLHLKKKKKPLPTLFNTKTTLKSDIHSSNFTQRLQSWSTEVSPDHQQQGEVQRFAQGHFNTHGDKGVNVFFRLWPIWTKPGWLWSNTSFNVHFPSVIAGYLSSTFKHPVRQNTKLGLKPHAKATPHPPSSQAKSSPVQGQTHWGIPFPPWPCWVIWAAAAEMVRFEAPCENPLISWPELAYEWAKGHRGSPSFGAEWDQTAHLSAARRETVYLHSETWMNN